MRGGYEIRLIQAGIVAGLSASVLYPVILFVPLPLAATAAAAAFLGPAIGIGTTLFGIAMIGHPRFGWAFALPGLGLGLLVLVLNFYTFPTPPAEAGLVDVGPFVGLWYLAATLQAWRSIAWAREYIE